MGWFRRLRCRLGLHGLSFKTQSDNAGIWGECMHCGHRVGYVSRAVLRRYADRKIAARRAKVEGE